MMIAIILTSCIWIAFAFFMDRQPSVDYGVNFIPILQALAAIIGTLVVWLLYFAVY